MGEAMTLTLEASDVSGQKKAKVGNVPLRASIGELVSSLLAKLNLPRNDSQGHPLRYQALLEREQRHLLDSEVIGESIKEDDRIVLQPNIDAGIN